MLAGAAAFVAIWRVLPALRPLAALASPPPVLWFLERAYRIFLGCARGCRRWRYGAWRGE